MGPHEGRPKACCSTSTAEPAGSLPHADGRLGGRCRPAPVSELQDGRGLGSYANSAGLDVLFSSSMFNTASALRPPGRVLVLRACSDCYPHTKSCRLGKELSWGHLSGTRASRFCLDTRSRRHSYPPCPCRCRTCHRNLLSNLRTRKSAVHTPAVGTASTLVTSAFWMEGLLSFHSKKQTKGASLVAQR